MTSPARGGPDTAGMREAIEGALLAVIDEWGEALRLDPVAGMTDALLPVVQRLAVEKAAEEVVELTHWLHDTGRADAGALLYLRDRASALAAAAQPTDGRTGE